MPSSQSTSRTPSLLLRSREENTGLRVVLLLVAVTLNAFEFFVPRIPLFPWLKPGLANCVTILWIVKFGGVDTLLFTLLRIWIVGFYFGFSFLTLVLSLSGGVLSTAVMWAGWNLLGRKKLLGYIGLGVLGALLHNTGQLGAVYLLMARNARLFYQIPLMLVASVVFGTLVALLVPVLESVATSPVFRSTVSLSEHRHEPARTLDIIFSFLVFAACVLLVFIDTPGVLAAYAIAATILVQILTKGSVAALVLPLRRFWLLFAAVAAFHMFLSYGRRIPQIPFLTCEGIEAAGVQCLRIWTWLQLTYVLTRFGFHLVVLGALKRLFPAHPDTLYAGVLALEFFPSAVDIVRRHASANLKGLFRTPLVWARSAVEKTAADVCGLVGGVAQREKAAAGREN